VMTGRAAIIAASHDMLGGKRETDMKLRLGFSVALIAVLFGVWLLLSKPSCLTGYRASFVPPSTWTCVSE
jgi:hypothetical protein